MRETNMIETFHKSWSEKMLPALLASLQLSTKLELQFGRPDDFQPGFAAAGHPAGAPYRRRPRRHRGRAAKEQSTRRAALFQSSRASPGAAPASKQAVAEEAIAAQALAPPPALPQPPPPAKPARCTSHQSVEEASWNPD